MKVILLQDVKGVGKKNQIIEVSDGYGSNFLIPRKLAVRYSEKGVEVRDKQIQHEKDEFAFHAGSVIFRKKDISFFVGSKLKRTRFVLKCAECSKKCSEKQSN